jgi:hypothetical protein
MIDPRDLVAPANGFLDEPGRLGYDRFQRQV